MIFGFSARVRDIESEDSGIFFVNNDSTIKPYLLLSASIYNCSSEKLMIVPNKHMKERGEISGRIKEL